MSKSVTGVLLAAGMGLRLGDITKEKPKALVEVAGKPLCFYALRFLELCGANEIIVVGGFEIEQLKQVISHFKNQVPIRILENKEYKKGNLLSLATALPDIDNSFLLVNTDHIYSRDIAKIVKSNLQSITAFVDYDRQLGADDMKVKLQNGAVAAMSKKLTDFDGGYVGMTYVDETIMPAYRAAVEAAHHISPETAVVEEALVQLAKTGPAVLVADISGHGWLEVDTPDERSRAETSILSDKKYTCPVYQHRDFHRGRNLRIENKK